MNVFDRLILKSERHYATKKTAAEKSSQSKIAGLSEDKAPPMVEFTYTKSHKGNQQGNTVCPKNQHLNFEP